MHCLVWESELAVEYPLHAVFLGSQEVFNVEFIFSSISASASFSLSPPPPLLSLSFFLSLSLFFFFFFTLLTHLSVVSFLSHSHAFLKLFLVSEMTKMIWRDNLISRINCYLQLTPQFHSFYENKEQKFDIELVHLKMKLTMALMCIFQWSVGCSEINMMSYSVGVYLCELYDVG